MTSMSPSQLFRPLSLPPLLTLRCALSQRILEPPRRQQSGAATGLATESAISAATSHPEASPEGTPELPILPYHVHRTASQQLPIYHLAKRGGNLQQTRIRKVEGDRMKLRDELQEVLGLKKENAVVHQVTGHIVLKGWYKNEVKKFLEERHF